MESQIPLAHQAPQGAYGGHPNPRHCQRARASPPPDPEIGCADTAELPRFTAEAMQPPRLQNGNLCSKILVTGACCTCLIILLVAWTAFLNLQIVVDARSALSERVTAPPPPMRKPLPAILHRYGTLRRGLGGAGGGRVGRTADPRTQQAAFPHWRQANGDLALETVVSDLALGLAAVVEQLDPSQELRIVSGAPPPPLSPLSPPPPELAPRNDELEEDSEL